MLISSKMLFIKLLGMNDFGNKLINISYSIYSMNDVAIFYKFNHTI